MSERVSSARVRELRGVVVRPCALRAGRCGQCEACYLTGDAPDALRDAAPDLAADLIDAREENARLRAQVDAVRAAREAVRSTTTRYDAAWTSVGRVPTAAQAEEIAARLTESHVAGDALTAALDALLSPTAPALPGADGGGRSACVRCVGGVTAWIETMPPKPLLCDCPAGVAARLNPPAYATDGGGR